jgi:hypothetical protein
MPIEPKQASGPSLRSPRPVAPALSAKPAGKFKITAAAIAIAVLALLTLATAGTAAYFYLQYQGLKNNPTKIVDDENKILLGRVGKLMLLPDNETPTIATITDLAPFKGQAFFDNAKIGFKVIIYTQAKRAILYDPTEDKIVEVAPLNMSQPANTNAAVNENANTNVNANTPPAPPQPPKK